MERIDVMVWCRKSALREYQFLKNENLLQGELRAKQIFLVLRAAQAVHTKVMKRRLDSRVFLLPHLQRKTVLSVCTTVRRYYCWCLKIVRGMRKYQMTWYSRRRLRHISNIMKWLRCAEKLKRRSWNFPKYILNTALAGMAVKLFRNSSDALTENFSLGPLLVVKEQYLWFSLLVVEFQDFFAVIGRHRLTERRRSAFWCGTTFPGIW